MHYNISKLLLRAWHRVALTSWKGGVSSSVVKACSFFIFLVFDKYMTISGFQIEETIDQETSGNLEQLLLAMVR